MLQVGVCPRRRRTRFDAESSLGVVLKVVVVVVVVMACAVDAIVTLPHP